MGGHSGNLLLLAEHLLGVLGSLNTLAASTAHGTDLLEILAAGLGRLAHLQDGELCLLGTAGLDRGGDQALDLGALDAVLLSLLGHTAADNVLAHIVFAGEVEQLADLAGALGSEAADTAGVRDTLDLGISALDNDDVKDGDIRRDDAATDVLATALTLVATVDAEAHGAALQEQGHTPGGQNTGDHGEAFFVRTTTKAENVARELFAKDSAIHVVTKTVVLEVHTAKHLVGDVELLDGSDAGVSDVKLHFELQPLHKIKKCIQTKKGGY